MSTTRRAPLGTFVGARSGDKGGAANVGLWVVDPAEASAVALAHGADAGLEPTAAAVAPADRRYAWLVDLLTVEGELQQAQHQVAEIEMPDHGVTADLSGHHQASDGQGQQPMKNARGQVPNANGLHSIRRWREVVGAGHENTSV